jgi:hypothetical protein
MKTNFTAIFLVLISAIINTDNVFAQNADKNIRPFSFTNSRNNAFKYMVIINDNSRNMATSYLRVMQTFIRDFEKAANESWHRINEKFVVHFTIDGKQTTALFNKKGKLLSKLSNCSEKDLSAETRELIKNSYSGYNIIRVIKTYHDGINFLIVQLEDDRSFVNLWWKNGEMQEELKYQKFK